MNLDKYDDKVVLPSDPSSLGFPSLGNCDPWGESEAALIVCVGSFLFTFFGPSAYLSIMYGTIV